MFDSGIKMCVIKREKLNELIAIINSQSKQLKKLRETLERIGADG